MPIRPLTLALGERRYANGHLVQVMHRAYWPSETLPCLVHERLHVAMERRIDVREEQFGDARQGCSLPSLGSRGMPPPVRLLALPVGTQGFVNQKPCSAGPRRQSRAELGIPGKNNSHPSRF